MKATIAVAGLLQAIPLVLTSVPAFPYEVVTVSGGGGIEGKVVFQGNVPVKKIIPTKDREVCGSPRDEPQISVGPDKGVQDAPSRSYHPPATVATTYLSSPLEVLQKYPQQPNCTSAVLLDSPVFSQ